PDMCSECSAHLHDPEERRHTLKFAMDRQAKIIAKYVAHLARTYTHDFEGRPIRGLAATNDHKLRVAVERYDRIRNERKANTVLTAQRQQAMRNNKEAHA
ncbi:MAG: hypothetical protein RI554_11555, partial [Trueperaceae bacterium]|nr:hypothetical protein [Trueperaceae bacterium]